MREIELLQEPSEGVKRRLRNYAREVLHTRGLVGTREAIRFIHSRGEEEKNHPDFKYFLQRLTVRY